MRALERSELRAIRDNAGRWQITSEALSDWLSMRPVRSDDRQSPTVTADTPDAVRIAVLETKLDAAQTRMTELMQERDEARADARAQQAMLAAALADMRNRPSLYERLAGLLRRP
jgi:hypothetical protein